MGTYAKEFKQKRAITEENGMFVLSTDDVKTFHRTFLDAAMMYGNVYGKNPLAGPIIQAPEIRIAKPKKPITFAEVYQKMSERYEAQAKSFEALMRRSQEIQKRSLEIRKEYARLQKVQI